MESLIKNYFQIDERSSSISQEIRAGITCFLTMSYILLVNAQVLNMIGVPSNEIVIGTALSSGVGTLIAGLFGNLPFGMAPGIGLSGKKSTVHNFLSSMYIYHKYIKTSNVDQLICRMD